LAVDFFQDTDELRTHWDVDHTWNPQMDNDAREKSFRLWKKAVTRSFDWVDDQPRP
jgi:glycerol kinase